jgi:cell shape-determining protein MreC
MTPERRPNIILLGALIAVFLFLVIFEPSYGWKIRAWFAPSNVMQGAANGGGSATGANDILIENESLKAELAELQTVEAELPTSSANSIRAMVYSRYPFDFKNEFLVNAGSANGVAAGAAVTYGGVYVGRVTQVWSDYAEVQTVFDNNFKLAVRIGPGGYDGLLTGGSYPYVASIAKSSPVAANDIVVSAASGTPYALPIGEVSATGTSPDNLFEQATLSFPYDVNQIETVLIAKGS